jgi:hypothetical protein
VEHLALIVIEAEVAPMRIVAHPGNFPPAATAIPHGTDNPSMTLVDDQQLRLLERLRQAGDRPLSFATLRDDGIHFPATVVGELEMHGYAIARVYEQRRMVGVRLVRREPPDAMETTGAVRWRRAGR